jgi:APA family basic amino acid/polyamine antiporter
MYVTFILAQGTSSLKRINHMMVIIKVSVILLFVIVAVWYVKPDNWKPFTPFGYGGVMTAADSVFFAYIGFDAIVSAAEETKNPKKDLPKGLLISLGICICLYTMVTAVMTGIVPFQMYEINLSWPIALVLETTGQNWIAGFIDLGAILGMTTILLVMLYGQTRIFFAMSRDGLLPKRFSQVNEKHRAPVQATWLLGTIAAFAGGILPLSKLSELINMGSLFAFTLVCIVVIVLRYSNPDLPRAFRSPGVPILPLIGAGICIFLMKDLHLRTWLVFGVWSCLGLIIYFTYSRKNAVMGKESSKR